MGNLTFSDIVIRLTLAFIAGFAIGWERESHGRPAGLRTNILACVAAATAMIISESLTLHSAVSASNSVRADPARLGAGILTGIGFLGGGTILRHENFIHGVTTAATLWLVTILGLAFGSGLFALGGIGAGFALVTLFVLSLIEKRLRSDSYATLTVVTTLDGMPEQDLLTRIKSLGPQVQAIKLHYELARKQRTLACDLTFKRPDQFELADRVVKSLTQIPGVLEVNWS